VPILVDGDVLLDGRNRLKVCLELGMEPKVQQFDHSVSAIQAIYDLNINRRTLTDDQIVVISAQLMAMKEAERAKQAQKAGVSADGAAGGRGRKKNLAANSTQGFRAPTTTQKIAKDAGVSDHKARQAVFVQQHAPELAEDVKCGKLPLKEAAKKVTTQRAAQKPAATKAARTNEWYTPELIVRAAVRVLGEIDLDPCSPPDPTVPAKSHFTRADDGLSRPWTGRVFMNPPYGREIQVWVAKLLTEYRKGNVTEAIALVPASTDTDWFNALQAYAVCFVFRRLKFSGKDNAPFPSALIYMGKNVEQFAEAFLDTGDTRIVYIPRSEGGCGCGLKQHDHTTAPVGAGRND
jgi:ParB-like chromosome segregation protein Spo0J